MELHYMNPTRFIKHTVEGVPTNIIATLDGPGPGGANHFYSVYPLSKALTPDVEVLVFQQGPVDKEPNGYFNEDLLEIVADRLRGFQYARNPDGTFDENTPGKFACPENAAALLAVKLALDILAIRTHKRLARGVEGKTTP